MPDPEPVTSETLSGSYFNGAKVTFYKEPKIRDVTQQETYSVLEVYDIDMEVDVSTTSNAESFGGAKLGWNCWQEGDEVDEEVLVSSGSYGSGEYPSLVFTSKGSILSIKGSFKANIPGWNALNNLQLVLTLYRSVGSANTLVEYGLSKVFYYPAPKA